MSDSIPDDTLDVPSEDTVELRKLRNSLQLVNQLPEDLLIEVLMIAKSSPLGSMEPPCIHYIHAASQVCSQWRRICLNSPLLWACIHIETLPLSPFADLCITRAKDVPISLSVNPSGHNNKLTVSNWKHLLRSLAARGVSMKRWRGLAIRVSDFEVFPDLLEHLVSYPTPNLEFIFCATQTRKYFAESHPNRRSSFVPLSANQSSLLSSSLPKLRSVELKRVHLAHLFDRNPPVLLTRLTRLRLVEAGVGHYAPHAFVLLLSSQPSIEELALNEHAYFQDGDPKSWPTISPVTFPSLRQLKLLVTDLYTIVGGMGLIWMTRFLQSIDAPGLQQLIIISPVELSDTSIEELVDFISTGYIPNQANVNEPNPARKLLYPVLRYLGAIFPLPKDTRLHKAESMLAALPSLTHLRILDEDVAVIDRTPRCSSGLTHLFIQDLLAPKELGDILHRRQGAGFPIRVLGLRGNEDVIGLPSEVELKRYRATQAGDFLDL
ncbi:unnamed protein product [Rhizoctonia solani]|uniref:F-box domain-containing protein n=1 Tax=Rhizoctonia solani TaxID=456999 RepID=A0A8H2WQD7_9AGAM|nr:unnamed protein product [Rhizoctonia solani]